MNSFCGCDLVGETYFIPERISDCENKDVNVKLLYPINAAVASIFSGHIKNKIVLKNLSKLYDAPQVMNIPVVHVNQPESDSDVLIENELNEVVSLKKLAKIAEKSKTVFLDKQDKSKQTSKVENWFRHADNRAIAATFILSIFGALAAILSIYNCCKSQRIITLFGTLMTNLRNAEAAPIECAENHNINYTRLFEENMFQLCIVIILFSLFKISRHYYAKWTMVKVLLPTNIQFDKSSTTHFHLEFCSPTKGMVRSYIGSIHTTILNIAM